MGDGNEPEAPGHTQVDEKREAALEPDEQVLPATLDRDDGVALELLGDLEEVVRPGQSRIEDLGSDDRASLEARCQL